MTPSDFDAPFTGCPVRHRVKSRPRDTNTDESIFATEVYWKKLAFLVVQNFILFFSPIPPCLALSLVEFAKM